MKHTRHIDRIRQAHKDGKLFAHMLEFNTNDPHGFEPEKDPAVWRVKGTPSFATLFGVLSGDGDHRYDSQYFNVSGKDGGFIGLPTTALKKGLPVNLFVLCDRLGILLDGNDTENVKPIMVGSSDMFSMSRNGVLRYAPSEIFPELASIQQLHSPETGQTSEFHATRDLPAMEARARAALPKLWNKLESTPWQEYEKLQSLAKGMNEVDIVAKLKGVRGLIINEMNLSERSRLDNAADYKQAVIAAKKLRDWLSEKYADVFTEKLPILSYNPNRTKEPLMELTEEKLLNPKLPIEKNSDQTTHSRVRPGSDYVGR